MLQFMRKFTKGWAAFIILLLVGLPFMFFGINDYFSARVANYVAKVGKTEIPEQDYRYRRERYLQQLRAQFGEQFNSAQFEDPTFKRNFLDQMIDKELLRQNADAIGLKVSDGRIREEIDKVDAFKVDGKFDPKSYTSLLKQQGMTTEIFENDIRNAIIESMLPTQLSQTALVSEAMIDTQIRLRDQKRDFRFVVMPNQDSTLVAAPTEKEIKAYYDTHPDEYRTQEMVAVDYVEMNATTMLPPAPADEATLREVYEKEKSRFGTLEGRLASHILIKPTSGDAAAQKAAADKAAKVAAEARAGKDFAELAKTMSEDPGSKDNGGELGWLEAGMTREAFDKKLFGMNAGEISDPVLSEDGYHVILLREIRPASIRSFEEVRSELEADYAKNRNIEIFNEKSAAAIDASLKNPSSLAEVANLGGLSVQRSQLFSRVGGPGIAMFPDVITSAFSDEVLISRNNSDALTVGENHIIILRLAEHKPAEVQKFDLVKPAVTARLQAKAIEDASLKKANDLLKQLKAGKALADLVPGVAVTDALATGRTGSTQDPTIVQEVFKLPRPAAGKSSKGQIRLPQGGYALLELLAVQDGDVKAVSQSDRDALRTQLAQQLGRDESEAFVNALRDKVEITVLEDKL